MNIELVRVVSTCPDALHTIDNLFDELTAYSQRVDGVARRKYAAQEFVTALPPGYELSHKHAFIEKLGGEAVGLVDIIDSYPSDGKAFIGLLAVRETTQEAGIGRALFQEVERFAQHRNNTEAGSDRSPEVTVNPGRITT